MKPILHLPFLSIFVLQLIAGSAFAQVPLESIKNLSDSVSDQVIEWRRDFHQNPELSNREFRTAGIIAEHLELLGMKVQTDVAHTGVVGILEGGKPGPVVLLRADMDGLPVEERNDLPFKSTARGEYNGEDVPVMHACGHDTHVAILLGAAEVLSSLKDELPGTVKFVFQPAEEGAPIGERGGAELMVEEGILDNPAVDAAFALHIDAVQEAGKIGFSRGARYASVDDFSITIHGQQSHGAAPWAGVDTVVVAAQIINALQTIVSRNMRLTEQPAVVTVGSIHGGVRSNIIPEKVELVGTIRALDQDMRELIHKRVNEIAEGVATSMGATVDVKIPLSTSYPVTANDPALAELVLPILDAIAGENNVEEIKPTTGAEDFSFISRQVPGVYVSLGGRPPEKLASEVAAHHTPDFYVSESGLDLGVQVMAGMAWQYLAEGQP